jgi:predicted Zn-dependent protease
MTRDPALVTLTPNEKRTLLEVALLLRDTGRLDEAEEALRALRPLVDDRAIPTLFLATVALQRGQLDAARDHVDEALRLRPRWGLALAMSAEVAIADRDLERARRILNQTCGQTSEREGDAAAPLTASLITLTDELTAPSGAGGV